MPLLIILIILLSIYIIKSENIKTAIKKDIEKIIPNNQHQHDKAQGEQHYNYNREISRKNPLYESNQDKQNPQTDTNLNDTITEIKTSFLKVLEILKTYYYKLKNAAKEYIKEIFIDKNVQGNIKDKKVEKPVEHVPQNNKLYQHNEEPSQYKVNEPAKEKKSASKVAYIISFIVSTIASVIGYYITFYCVAQNIADSYSQSELDYYAYMYGDVYGYHIIGQIMDTMSLIYKIVIAVTFAVLIGSGYSYLRDDNKSKKEFWIVLFAAIGIFLGTFIFHQALLSEI